MLRLEFPIDRKFVPLKPENQNCRNVTDSGSLYEESREFEVGFFDRNVPWAQQADKKSLNVGYKNQTIIFKICCNLGLDLQCY